MNCNIRYPETCEVDHKSVKQSEDKYQSGHKESGSSFWHLLNDELSLSNRHRSLLWIHLHCMHANSSLIQYFLVMILRTSLQDFDFLKVTAQNYNWVTHVNNTVSFGYVSDLTLKTSNWASSNAKTEV